MKPIQMVDLKQQYFKIKNEIDAAVLGVIDSSIFIGGPQVNTFAQNLSQYLGAKHVIPCANGTDALQIAMMALGLEPGDEVITPSFTYVATTEVIALLRLKPVFVEVDTKTFCVEPKAIRKAITSKTKAIVPVHLYGHSAKMEEIMVIAKEHNLFVIEDNAQAIGGDYYFKNGTVKKTGIIGDIGCTSFFPSKNLGCYGDGGAMCTNDDEIAEKLKMIANHGQSKRYYHDMVGCNSRLDALQAAILNIKLPLLDSYIDARRKAADFYDNAFAGNEKITIPYRADYCKHVFHQYTIILEDVDRQGLVDFLAQKSIPSMLYYPVPAHRQKMFASFGGSNFALEKTDWLTERVISLPIHTELDEEQQNFITGKVLEFVNK
ncbi:DegT/DnrJ/EryC1/StrS family aminotransferase [Ginsengibacter hankyongi]|uniref:DegT/DnrJ/EryC1/StrS family aminotransferase n=1 Tax=Ginsengibacter hankyongi TaxID=2607284 RepID=A0A5J5II26_9BACT|nr:DegT/DnrJ/EryC1/StrS family aminotransferase [Ginsengibacter hankyongi]KAA9039228.1 DegT/DnrJ/EryC1/StrS family aminotransferase [Ginsengibacter hankyongi]